MTENICRYSGDREQAIVSYLYSDSGEADDAAVAVFGEHLSTCERCRSEVAAFEGVRLSLARWAPPGLRAEDHPGFGAAGPQPSRNLYGFGAAGLQPSRHLAEVGGAGPHPAALSPKPPARNLRFRERPVPAWAQAAAAVLVLGVAAGIANLDIQYDADGLRVRTGWLAPAAAPAMAVASRSADEAWRAELTALEGRLRAELRPAPTAPIAVNAASAANTERTLGPEALRRIRSLVEESERRQQRELALRLGEAMREVSVQRQEDLVRIDRNIGAIQNNTGREMLRQRSDLLNYVTVRTAARPQ